MRSRVALGTIVRSQQLLYQLLVLNKSGERPEIVDVCAERGGIVFDLSTNQAVNQGEYVLGLWERET
ncbi:hypothetical protein AY599_07510 [Leptolyngbya valderiana BDU 20041]|nr:hypothetical protein AY599_07510 [Leptolyngbya valderiana BDU 20041]